MSVALTPARASGRDHEVDADPRAAALARELDEKRGAIVRHCARMLGSPSDAEDAAQETMVRAWRGLDHFEERSSLQTWLYAIATNVCLSMLRGSERRPLPVDVDALGLRSAAPSRPSFEHPWLLAVAPLTLAEYDDPADRAISHEDTQRAVAIALELLPPRQRAVLFLRVVCSWRATEVAELLGSSVAAVNSALQRARAALHAAGASARPERIDIQATSLFTRYVDALERADVARLVALAHEDAVCGASRSGSDEAPPNQEVPMLKITDQASSAISVLVSDRDLPDGAGLRIATADEPERGLTVAATPVPESGDQVIEAPGARVFVEPTVAPMLEEQVLDVATDDGRIAFKLTPQ